MLRWKKAIWLAVTRHMTSWSQLECNISAKHSYAILNFVYDIHWRQKEFSVHVPTNEVHWTEHNSLDTKYEDKAA